MQQDIRKGFLHENYYRITDIQHYYPVSLNWDIFYLQSNGIRVNEFSLGLGPTLFGIQKVRQNTPSNCFHLEEPA